MSMGLVIAICGAFMFGFILGAGLLYLYWIGTIRNGPGLHSLLHGIAKTQPTEYSLCCPLCEAQTAEILGTDYKHPKVYGCVFCDLK